MFGSAALTEFPAVLNESPDVASNGHETETDDNAAKAEDKIVFGQGTLGCQRLAMA